MGFVYPGACAVRAISEIFNVVLLLLNFTHTLTPVMHATEGFCVQD